MSRVLQHIGIHESRNLRRLAAEMRANAAQTELESYVLKLKEAADDLDNQADLLEQTHR